MPTKKELEAQVKQLTDTNQAIRATNVSLHDKVAKLEAETNQKAELISRLEEEQSTLRQTVDVMAAEQRPSSPAIITTQMRASGTHQFVPMKPDGDGWDCVTAFTVGQKPHFLWKQRLK